MSYKGSRTDRDYVGKFKGFNAASKKRKRVNPVFASKVNAVINDRTHGADDNNALDHSNTNLQGTVKAMPNAFPRCGFKMWTDAGLTHNNDDDLMNTTETSIVQPTGVRMRGMLCLNPAAGEYGPVHLRFIFGYIKHTDDYASLADFNNTATSLQYDLYTPDTTWFYPNPETHKKLELGISSSANDPQFQSVDITNVFREKSKFEIITTKDVRVKPKLNNEPGSANFSADATNVELDWYIPVDKCPPMQHDDTGAFVKNTPVCLVYDFSQWHNGVELDTATGPPHSLLPSTVCEPTPWFICPMYDYIDRNKGILHGTGPASGNTFNFGGVKMSTRIFWDNVH